MKAQSLSSHVASEGRPEAALLICATGRGNLPDVRRTIWFDGTTLTPTAGFPQEDEREDEKTCPGILVGYAASVKYQERQGQAGQPVVYERYGLSMKDKSRVTGGWKAQVFTWETSEFLLTVKVYVAPFVPSDGASFGYVSG